MPKAGPFVLALVSLLGTGCRKSPPPASEISLSVPYELSTFDPHEKDLLSNVALLSHVYEPLVTSDASMAIRSCLAERWVSPDPLTWILTLRPGVRFHSGAPLTSADVVATFERVSGARNLEVSGYLMNVASVKALDEQRVEIRTKSPMSILLQKIRYMAITRKGVDPARETDGTGPYRLSSPKPGPTFELTRHEEYWGRKPAFQRVTFRLKRTPDQALDDFLAGTSPLVQANTRRVESALRGLTDVTILKQSSIFVKFLAFDVKRDETPGVPGRKNPFRDVRVRRAVRLAIDRAKLAASLSSYAVPTSQPVPPFIFGFDPSIPETPYDAAKARALLAEAGLPGGFTVTLHTRQLLAESAGHLKAMLAEVGIDVKVLALPDAEYFPALSRREGSMYLSRFGCPSGDVSDLLDKAIHTVEPARHFGESNNGDYTNPELDRLIEESSGLAEMSQRRPVLQQIIRKVMDDAAFLPLYADLDVFLMRKVLSWQPRSDGYVFAFEVARAGR